MIDPETDAIMQRVVEKLLANENAECDKRIRSVAAKNYENGVAGSEFGWLIHIRAYHDHYRELAAAIWEQMKRVLQTVTAPLPARLASDLRQQFDGYLKGPSDRIRDSLYASGLTGKRMPNPTFAEIVKDIEAHYHNEIDLWVRSAVADRKREERMGTNITYHNNLTGDNPRVNIGSTDYSINIKNSEAIFRELRTAIETGIEDAAKRDELAGKVDELQAAIKDKPKFLKSYTELISLAANHISVIAPFIPAITEFLKS